MGDELLVSEGASAADVLRAAIASATARIVEHEPVIRAGTDSEGIHQARVGCRRLRSDLRTFAPVIEPGWADPLRDELRWLAGELGGARDLDVLGDRLRRQLATGLVDDDDVAVAGVLARLDRQRSRAAACAVAALDTRRYLELLDRLVDASRSLPMTDEGNRPAIDVVPALAAAPYRRLRKAVRRTGKQASDEELHELRIKAKRARYAADLAVPVVGKDAVRYTRSLARLQDVLGDLHDCAVAEAWLVAARASATRAQAFVLGALASEQRREARQLRAMWRGVWAEVDEANVTAWLR